MQANFSNIQLGPMAIHRVGNRFRAERNFISSELYRPDEAMQEALMKYFLKSLKRSQDWYRFQHENGPEYNELFGFATTIFEEPERLLSESVNILEHLYRQSSHPNIKSGEVYVAYFSDILFGDELVSALGIFKSEQKNTFLQITKSGEMLIPKKEEGFRIDKLDKGCLILNTEKFDGYRLVSVDNNQYDANYWLYQFLNVGFVQDENYYTRSYLDLCNNFSKEVVMPAHDKKEQMQFLSDSVEYFNNNDSFNFDDFANTVVPDNEPMAAELRNYQQNYALGAANNFEISKPAIKSARSKFKSTIKLDNDIQIRLDLNNPDVSSEYIEKGFDEERQMSFYKIYFNEEME